MELRAGLGRHDAVLGQEPRVVEIYGVVEAPAGRVVIDDFDVLTDRPGLKVFPRDKQRGHVAQHTVQTGSDAGVKREDTQPAEHRVRQGVIRDGGASRIQVRASCSLWNVRRRVHCECAN